MLVLTVLGPVFSVIALGALLERSRFFAPGFLKEGNRVTYWLGLPALLFSELVRSFRHVTQQATWVLSALLCATCGVLLVAYLCAYLLRVPASIKGTFVQGAFRGNLAFVGLPIVVALPEVNIGTGLSLKQLAVLVLAPTMVFYNAAGVNVLLLSQHRLSLSALGPLVRQLALTPPLLATLAGIAFALTGLELPHPVARSFELLGDLALPLGLLCVGGSLGAFKLYKQWHWTMAAALLKALVSPALGWCVARAFGLGAPETRLVMIFMACPTAIVSYTVALELKGDGPLASSVIAASCLASLGVLATLVVSFN